MNRNQYILLGTLAFLGVYSGLKVFRPVEGGVVDLQLHAADAPQGEALNHAASGETIDQRSAVASAAEASAPVAVESDPEPASGPLAQFSGALTTGGLWHVVDLSDWRQVQTMARSLEFSITSVGGIDEDDEAALLELLDRTQSVKVKQTLLVALGVLRRGAPLELEMHLDDPATAAAAAYALGRRGLPEAEFALQERLALANRFGRDLTNLDLGLASRGFERFDDLVQLTRQRLLVDWTGSEVTPLELIRDPRARGALHELALSGSNEALRLRALRGWANTFEMARSEDRTAADTGWVGDLALAPGSSPELRAEAIDVLGRCAPDECQRVLQQALADGATEAQVLEVMGAMVHLPSPSAELGFLEPLLEGNSPALRREALRLLAHTGRREAMDLLGEQLAGLDAEAFGEVAGWLQSRAKLAAELERMGSSNGVPDFLVTAAFADQLDTALASRDLTEELRLALLQAQLHGPRREAALVELQEVVEQWDLDDPLALQQLQQLAPGLGAAGDRLVMQAYGGSEEFIVRLELVQSLESSAAHNPEVERFLREEVMADLRSGLLDQASAPLAFFKRGVEASNLFASSVVNLFVRYGTEEDLRLLQELPQAFEAQASRWPSNLRDSIRASLEECALRTQDLRAMEAIG